MRSKQLVIFGTGNVADIMIHYFLTSWYQVAAITVHSKHIESDTYKGLPVVPFETIENTHPPADYDMFVAVGYNKLNHLRAKIYEEGKAKGYNFATYIDEKAKIHNTATVGENTFIFEFNNVQYKANIGNNVILWSANHIGHETIVRDHVYIASHVVISGFCDIGEYSFIGVNATFADEVKLGKNCLVGAGAYVARSTEDAQIFAPPKPRVMTFDDLSPKAQDMWRPEGV